MAGEFEVYEDRAGKSASRSRRATGRVVATDEAYESRVRSEERL
ncbi:MAG: hypothetical protein QOF00_5915 [Pseudonocardiales bacterium]|jgi:uncharacterized protein YegP (UPF0339 family)|nr:hypothetical protein [Pseudonocardiales bacterium]